MTCHRLLVVLCSALMVASCARGVDSQKFEAVYRAGKGVEGALSVGVTYAKFGELVQGLATEVSIARDKARNDAERHLVALYSQALTGCSDSLALWKVKLAGVEDVGVSNPEMKRISDSYAIQGRGTGTSFQFPVEAAIQTVWADVGRKLSAASRVYAGQTSGDLPPLPN